MLNQQRNIFEKKIKGLKFQGHWKIKDDIYSQERD